MGLLDALKHKVLVADGAMGTLLYSYGLENCHEEMNIEKPEIIKKIHSEYIQAGADVIQTNTYGANRIKLTRYGLESKVVEINEGAIGVAKQAAKNSEVFILGSIGGIRGVRKVAYTLDEILAAVRE